MKKDKFMYFYEIAEIYGVSTKTLRKRIEAHPDKNVSILKTKRGTGTYFYTKAEAEILLSAFSF